MAQHEVVLPPWHEVPALSNGAQSFGYLEQVAGQVGTQLLKQGLFACTAESCTGGMISCMFTAISGSSSWFERGFVTYTNQAKEELLGVKHETLKRYGAVSEFTAVQMAQGALNHSHADLAVAVTGIAGPTGGTPTKPVGTVCMAVCSKKPACQAVTTFHFSGDRATVRAQTTYEAMRALSTLASARTSMPVAGDGSALAALGFHTVPQEIEGA